jgi:putative transposase
LTGRSSSPHLRGGAENRAYFARRLPGADAFACGECTCGSSAGSATDALPAVWPLHSCCGLAMPSSRAVGGRGVGGRQDGAGVHRPGGYKNPTVNERHSKEIRERVKAVFEQSEQRYGADKILAVLEEDGIPTSKRLVSRIMREEGLQSIRVHAKSDYEGLAPKRNLVQCHFQADAPNVIWVSDVTCLKINQSTQYVCVILDLFSRKVLSFRISTCNSTQLITSAFKEAFCLRGRPAGLTFHSDQGTQYTAVAFRRLLKKCGVAQSFSHSGRPTDNAVAEAFFSSMKREELYRRNYRSEKDFRDSVAAYIHFYNTERPHRSNDYHSPDYVERECRRAHK